MNEGEPNQPTYVYLVRPDGGPAAGFQCNAYPKECRAVTRTEKGMRIHLGVCHGVRFQKDLPFEPAEPPDLPKGILRR